ncbi:cell division protein [Thioflexithrix psekupsensis]|uniref:Peptidoglycan D,D-transpeptidase FtsI n=1 Tax=Thioflexithrix psekupsensis TaxID=1570016 RepID=A0A251XBA8_9GAMM|nr:cell division protein [Thioflexithrix psekupsensis]
MPPVESYWGRRQWLLLIMVLVICILLARAAYLQVMHTQFLQTQGDARHIRTVTLPAHRGLLLDRHGTPLAMSTPIESIWVNPKLFLALPEQIPVLSQVLDLSSPELLHLLRGREQREFAYIRRHVPPSLAQAVQALKLQGVFLQQEYGRYYPEAEITAHILGFTNIDDEGQEGLELALNRYLMGVAGSKQVIQTPQKHSVAELAVLQNPRHGQDVELTLDRRLQYMAYRELKTVVEKTEARAGAAVLLDVHTGEVLAMVNQPAYNPNDRLRRDGGVYRNRAVTDVFEPGSTMKTFIVAAGLAHGRYTLNSRIDTRPGYFQLGKYTVRDPRNYGEISLATLMQKSSNVGASRIALSLDAQALWQFLRQFGFGDISASGFPGEAKGHLSLPEQWQTVDQATLAFGYGLNVTLLQLARAYAVFGNGGRLPTVHFVRATAQMPQTWPQVISPTVAENVLRLLEGVTSASGTAPLAQVANYRVAGKTGTARKHQGSGYVQGAYISLFVGLAPVDNPRWVMAVMIDEAKGEEYYGGQIAAPVFSAVMDEALRGLGVAR